MQQSPTQSIFGSLHKTFTERKKEIKRENSGEGGYEQEWAVIEGNGEQIGAQCIYTHVKK